METLKEIRKKVFKTLYDITGEEIHKDIFLNGFLIPSKGVYEIWFPYSIEAAKLLKPGIFLAVKNFASIRLTDTQIKKEKTEEHYSILEVIDVDIMHYKIKELSENPQNLLIEDAFSKFMKEWYRHAYEPEKETLKIIVKAISHDEELIICTPERALELGTKKTVFFRKTSELPISGERVFIIEPQYLEEFVNGNVPQKPFSFKAGKHKIFESIDIYIDQEPLFNRHFAVFGFTGSGKSNLMSTLIHKSLIEVKDSDNNPTNILVFDINNEYLGLLFDILVQKDGALVFIDDPGGNLSLFLKGIFTKEIIKNASRELIDRTTLPKALLKTEVIEKLYLIAEYLLLTGKVRILTRGKLTLEVFETLYKLIDKVSFTGQGAREKKEALIKLFDSLRKYLEIQGLLGTNFNPYVAQKILEILTSFVRFIEGNPILSSNPALNVILSSDLGNIDDRIKSAILPKLKKLIQDYKSIAKEILKKTDYFNGITLQELILKNHDNTSSLFIFISEDDNKMRDFAHDLGDILYKLRKNGQFTNMPQTVFILEEADLFIPNTPTGAKEEKSSIEKTKHMATMLARRGRKYNLGLAIATQRVTYLDTSITAQLATYFVSKLPKKTDRERVAEAFGIEASVLDQTLSYFPGEWMVLTHVDALHRKAVPVPIKFENANKRLEKMVSELEYERIKELVNKLKQGKSSQNHYDENNTEIFTHLPPYEDLTPVFVED